MLDDLLDSVNDWSNIDSVVKASFRALGEMVKLQANSIKELERQIPTKASRAELNSGLACKANPTDITRAVNDLSITLDSKLNIDAIQSMIEDRVSRADIAYVRAATDELRTKTETKADIGYIDSQITNLRNGMDDLRRECARIYNEAPSKCDIHDIFSLLETKANTQDINTQLQEKANKQSVSNALHRKANRTDVDAALSRKIEITEIQTLSAALESKAEASQLETLAHEVSLKVDRLYLEDGVLNEVRRKAEQADIDRIIEQLAADKLDSETRLSDQLTEVESYMNLLKNELEKSNFDVNQQLHLKADNTEMDKMATVLGNKADTSRVNELATSIHQTELELQQSQRESEEAGSKRTNLIEASLREELTRVNQVAQEVQDLRRQDHRDMQQVISESLISTKRDILSAIQSEVDSLQADKVAEKSETADIKANIAQKADRYEIQDLVGQTETMLTHRMSDIREELRSMIVEKHNETISAIRQKADLDDLRGKADFAEINDQLGVKLEQIDYIAEKVASLQADLSLNKVEATQITNSNRYLSENIDNMGKELLLKANIKDMWTLLDVKANIDDINSAFKRIQDDIDAKSPLTDLSSHIQDQTRINEALCVENCIGRWIWRSGQVRANYHIPWEIQSVNTSPDNYIWKREKTSLVCVTPGLYEITMGFFCSDKPNVQLMVNGEVVMSGESSSATKYSGKHTLGNIPGFTIGEFVSLPARSRIAVTYSGEPGSEGFLGLKKL